MSDPVDLTSLANAKGWLNISTSASDALLARLITACSQYIQSWLNRTIRSQSYSEDRHGHGGSRLALLNSPVTAVSLVKINGATIPVRPSLGSNSVQVGAFGAPYGYIFDDISIIVCGGCFARGFGNVHVEYTAGYATTPPDLEQACIDMIGDWFKYRDRIGKLSEGIEGQTISFVNQPIPARTMGVLQQYRQVVPIAA